MPASCVSYLRRLFVLGAVLLLGGTAVLQADPDPAKKPEEAPAPGKNEPAPKSTEKLIAFEFRDKPWRDVMEWFSDHSGLPFISNVKPTGTFTFIPPKTGARQFTLAQIIDILNEALLSQKYVLIRRNASFTLVPADEKIDPSILPRITVEELSGRGNTELMSIVLPLSTLVAEDLAPEVKKMLGPFGEVVAMARANQLILQDTAGNLKRVVKTIKDIEENEKGQAESFSHTCKYIKARDGERVLREMLGDPREIQRAESRERGRESSSPFGGFSPFGGLGGFGGFGGGSSPFSRGGDRGSSDRGSSDRGSSGGSSLNPKQRMHYISSDERTNTVLVSGPADKIALARDIMKKLDVQQQGQPPVLMGPPILKTYNVAPGSAEALSRTLQDIYKASNTIRISAVGGGTIMVWAGPDDQIEIARHIIGQKEQATAEMIALTALDAGQVVATLKGMYGDTKSGAPYLEADTNRNTLFVKGSAEQVEEVKRIIKTLGEGGGPPSTMRIITINQGSAATLAEALERLLPQMRKNPVQVIIPGQEPKEKPKEKPKDGDSRLPESDNHLKGEFLVKADDKQLVDPQKDKAKSDKPGRDDAPVKITAFGNRLIITSEDPAALALAQELIKLLTTTPAGEGDFEIIKLKNANAVEAAKILDEAFNGVKRQEPRQQGGDLGGLGAALGGLGGGGGSERGGGGSLFSRFGGAQAQPPANPSANRIRVVADPATNSLLVRASPLDMLTIRRLLEKAIDSGEIESRAVLKTWIIGPLKHASATEISSVVRDVYRESMNSTSTTVGSFGGVGGFGVFGSRGRAATNTDINGNPRGVSLSVGVDDRSNSLVVNCTESMYEDVKKLVDQLEAAAKDSSRTVRVVSIKGVDPVLVQQAIDAIQGRSTPTRASSSGSSGQFGSRGGDRGSSFVPFGTGGVIPGMSTPGASGTTRPFGGFTPGGSSGGGRGNGPPGGGRGPNRSDDRGPDFFEQRVMDDPQQSPLFDPQQDASQTAEPGPAWTEASDAEEQEQQAQPPKDAPPADKLPADGTVRGPRSPVTAEALEQLGVIVISGNNPTDVEEIVKIIEYIQRLGAGAEAQIQLVPLDHADATSVSSTLSQMFQQIIVGATGNVRAPVGQGQPQGGQQGQGAQQAASVVLLPLARLNSILIAAPRARLEDIVREIKRLDRPNAPQGGMTAFPLKKANASRVATLLQQFYAQRYPNETAAQHQIRITFDESTNTVFVQAAPADLAEIRNLIERIDSTVSSAVNDLRIIPLRNAVADELANLLLQAISQGFATPSTSGFPGGLQGGGLGGGLGGLGAGRLPGAAGGLGQQLPGAALSGGAGAGLGGQQGSGLKGTSLRFFSTLPGAKGAVESGLLEDIHITADLRTNSLVIAAPSKTMDLLLSLIRELDVAPAARAEIKIFTLRKADASAMATLLQQLYLGTGTGTGLGGIPGGIPGQPGGIGQTGAAGGFQGATGIPRPLMTLGGAPAEGVPLIDLKLSVDSRTNSLIIAGSRNDLEVIEAIISRLEDADVETRHNQVYKLKNAQAADVATALQNFLTRSLQVLATGQQLTAFQEIERDVVIVPEPISNTLLISATPRWYAELVRMIQELDAQPPQVVIQVMIAEVNLNDSEEFGVEVGLQSPVLFARSVIPAPGQGGTVTYTQNANGLGLVPAGVTVNNTLNPAALPGFNFNSTGPLGNNPVVGPAIVGFQGLQNLGVNRFSPRNQNVGGLVFSAASDTFSLLIRALKIQQRLDILSRPQITTLDNQAASILIGQAFPYSTGTNVTGTGIITNNVSYRNIGVQLDVTPRITPDGRVIMRVTPQISSAVAGTIALGGGVNAQIFNVQTVDTTVVAQDGETVAIGGLISKINDDRYNKIPWLGDLPKLGALFRYHDRGTQRRELLVIMTPHIIRCPADADRVLAEESRRIDWIVGDIVKMHGTTGLEPILGPPPPGAPESPNRLWFSKEPANLPPVLPNAPEEMLPPPTKLPPVPGEPPAPGNLAPAAYQTPAAPAPATPKRKTRGLLAPFFSGGTGAAPAEKEDREWNPIRKSGR